MVSKGCETKLGMEIVGCGHIGLMTCERGLQELVGRGLRREPLRFSSELSEAVGQAEGGLRVVALHRVKP